MGYRDRRDASGMSRRPSGSSPTSWRDQYGSPNWNIDPVSQFRRLSDQMDRWFDSFGMGRSGERSESMNVWAPEMEAFLRDDQFVVRIDLPGLTKDEVNVEVTDDSLLIHGERQQTHEENRDGYYRSERTYGRFYREVPLPDGAQPESAKANYRDGVLEVSVTVPPREVHRPRKIEIGSNTTESQERAATPSSASQPGPTPPTTGGGQSINVERNISRGDRAVAHEKPPRSLDTE